LLKDSVENRLILLAAQAIADPIFVLDRNGKYVTIIGGKESSLYDSSKHLIGKTINEVLPIYTADFFLTVIQKAIQTQEMQILEYHVDAHEIKSSPKDGPSGRQWFEGRVSPVQLDESSQQYVIWSAINITEKKQTEAERQKLTSHIEYLANHDYLTGLPSLRHSLERLDSEMNKVDESGTKLALLFIDLDGFKQVNDTYGHEAGDVVLKEVAQRFIQSVRTTDTVCRIGGDEFIILLPEIVNYEILEMLCQNLVKAFHRPVEYLNNELYITISVGASIYPDFADNSVSLRKRADEEMFKVKNSGKNNYSIPIF
jgi:diguanylate cyclase (GGDEF)-like protein/PAS domain S-box-containing protein